MAFLDGMVRCGMDILRLVKANIKHKRGAFKGIAALMAIIVLSFTGTISNNDNIDRTLSEANVWSGIPDMTAFMPLSEADDKTLAAVTEDPGVAGMKTVDCVMSGEDSINGQELYQASFVYPESYKVYRVFNESMNGYIEDPEPLAEGEVYIPYSLIQLYDDVKIGSEVEFVISETDAETPTTCRFKIKGFIADPNFGAAVIGTKRFFVSDADFEKMYNDAAEGFRFIEAAVDLHNSDDFADVKKSLDESCGFASKSNLVISAAETNSYTKLYSETGSGIVAAFVILLVVIAVITMYHSITTSVEMEYTDLGVLKALGFTTGRIRLVFIIQYAAAEVIGAVIGLALSVPALRFLGTLFQPITGLATVHRISFLKSLALSAAVIAVCMIFVFLATSKVGKISPVRAISGGKNDVYFDSRINIPVKAKPLSLFIGLRRFTSGIKSSTGVIFIAALLVYFMMSITVLSDRLSSENIIEGMVSPDIVVVPSEKFEMSDMEKFEETVHSVDENAKVLFNSSAYIMADGVELYCDAAYPCDFLYKPLDGRMPVYDNEIAVTEIVSEELSKKIGDTVTLGSGEKKREFIITGYYQSLSDLGRTFTITSEGMYKITGNRPNCYIELSDRGLSDKASAALEEAHEELIGAKIIEEENHSADGMIEMIDSICKILVAVVFAVSIVFAAVVISMVCSKSFIRERTDLGILKSLGFTSDSLRRQFAFRFMIIAVTGSALGGAASFFFTSPLLEALMKIVGLTQIKPNITPLTFIIPAASICASFFVFSYIFSGKIKSVEVRELITE
ncbi:MAG: ABC transporter permease [Oscillospiraceae bacterium]